MINRRSAFLGIGTLFAAPAIVSAGNLMNVRGICMPVYHHRVLCDYAVMTDELLIRIDKAQHEMAMPKLLGVSKLQPPPHIANRLVDEYSKIIGDVDRGHQRYLLGHVEQKAYVPGVNDYEDFNPPDWDRISFR